MAAAAEKARRRWFRVTPDRCVVALLALEAFLLLSAWFHWFAFNDHKGWTVVITVAAVGVALLLMSLWFLAALAFRLRFQFSISSLLLLVVVVAVPFSWLATEMKAAKKQGEAVKAVKKAGGWVRYSGYYDDQYDTPPLALPPGGATPPRPSATRPPPAWLRRVLGNDLFTDVAEIHCSSLGGPSLTDADLEHLEGLTQLKSLDLGGTEITNAGLQHVEGLIRLRELNLWGTDVSDAALEHLKELRQLQELWLTGTVVTNAGVKKLQQALPNCQIYH